MYTNNVEDSFALNSIPSIIMIVLQYGNDPGRVNKILNLNLPANFINQ